MLIKYFLLYVWFIIIIFIYFALFSPFLLMFVHVSQSELAKIQYLLFWQINKYKIFN